jgi:hypothetical protein
MGSYQQTREELSEMSDSLAYPILEQVADDELLRLVVGLENVVKTTIEMKHVPVDERLDPHMDELWLDVETKRKNGNRWEVDQQLQIFISREQAHWLADGIKEMLW